MSVPELEALTVDSGEAQVKAALSSCIAMEVKAGKEQSQAIATCHAMIRERVGEAPGIGTPPDKDT